MVKRTPLGTLPDAVAPVAPPAAAVEVDDCAGFGVEEDVVLVGVEEEVAVELCCVSESPCLKIFLKIPILSVE